MDRDRLNYLLMGVVYLALSLLSACKEGPVLSVDTLGPPMGAKFPDLVLQSVTPVDGATKVPIRPRIVLKFNNQVQASSLTVNTNTLCTGSVQVSKNDFFTCVPLVPAHSNDFGYTYDVWVTSNLEVLTNYKIKVTSAVEDIIGKNLTNPYVSTLGFVTEDNVQPEVDHTAPPTGAVDVNQNTSISIIFSKAINSQTITTNIGTSQCIGNFQVSKDGFFTCVPMWGPPMGSPNLETFTVNPISPLDSEAIFQIRALQSIEDLSGNNLKTQYVGQGFKVKDWVPPTVSSTFPQALAVEVPLNTPIIITFSEFMDSSSITANIVNNNCEGTIQLSKDDFSTCVQMQAPPITTNLRTYTINPKDDLIQGSVYQIKVTSDAQDVAGNNMALAFLVPGFSTVALPFVVSVIPPPGEMNVPYEATLTVNFNKGMDASSVFSDPNSTSCEVASFVISKATDNFAPDTCIPLQVVTPSNGNKTFSTKSLAPLEDQETYKIRIAKTVRDTLGYSPEDDFIQDPGFKIIDTTPPNVGSSIPADGQEDVLVNEPITIIFDEPMDVASLSNLQATGSTCMGAIQLSRDGFLTCLPFNSQVPTYNAAQTQFSVTPLNILDTGTIYEIKITTDALDVQGNPMAANEFIEFATLEDIKVAETDPPDSLTPLIPRSTDISVTFNRAMNATTITAQTSSIACTGTIQLSNNNFSDCVIFNSQPIEKGNGTIFTVTPQVPLENFRVYKIRVLEEVEDTYGSNLKSTYTQQFGFQTEDTIPPTVVTTNPLEDAILVDRDTDITITFDEAMDPLSITTSTSGTTCTGSIQLSSDDFGTCVPMQSAPIGDPNGITWMVTPATTLDNFAQFKIKVTTAAKDAQGNNMAAEFEQTNGFTTIDNVPPTVLATIPSDGTTGVPIDATITVNFSEPMDINTVSGSSGTCIDGTVQVRIGPGFGSCVPMAAVTPSNNNQDFTFFPQSDLADDGTIYRIVVTTAVEDQQGNSLANEVTADFRTIDLIPPSVSNFSPGDSTTQAIDRPISVTFSEDIDVSTLITTSADGPCTNETWFASSDGGINCIGMNPFVTSDNIFFTMTSLSFWPRGQTITVFITDLISDPVGATLTSPVTYTFFTEDPGQALMTTPVDGTNEILLDTMINIFWDRPMNINTMTLNNINSNCSGNIQVSGDNFANCVQMNSTLPVDLGGEIYQLTPASDLEANINYTVRVLPSVLTFASPTGWPVDQDFSFTTIVPPTILSLTPIDGAIGVLRDILLEIEFSKVMDPLTVTVNSTDNACLGTVQLSEDPGFATCTQFAGAPSTLDNITFSFDPSADLDEDKTYYFKVTTGVADSLGQSMEAESNTSFDTIDDIPPSIISQGPTNGSSNNINNTSIAVTFDEEIDISTLFSTPVDTLCNSSISFQVSTDSFINCLGTSNIVYTNSNSIATVTPISYLPNSSPVEVKILSTVTDLAGNQMGSDTSWNFTTGDAPEVSSIIPADGLEYADINTDIVLDFNKPMATPTFNFDTDNSCVSGNIHLSTDANFAAGNCLSFSAIVWNSPTQASLTIDIVSLPPETQFYFRLDNTVTDSQWGLNLENDFNSQFKTQNLTAPTLVLPTIPTDGATNVTENQFIQIRFSEDMDGTTITTNNGATACTGNVQVSSDFTFTTCHPLEAANPVGNSTIYSINPSDPFLSNTFYRLKILGPGGVADPSGNFMALDYEQDPGFQIGDFTKPILVSSTPAQGSTQNTNPQFLLEFSEVMEPSTLNTFAGILTGPCPATNTVGFLVSEDANFTTCVPMTDASGGTNFNVNYTYLLAQGLKNNTNYWYIVTTQVEDLGGNNMATPTVVSFTVNDPNDNFPTIISPPDKATNVSFDLNNLFFLMVFDNPVNTNSVTNNNAAIGCNGTIQLSKLEDNFSQCVKWATAPMSASDTDFNLGFLENNLEPDTIYVLKVGQGISNQSGTPFLRNDYYFSFKTGGAPQVVSMSPADGTTDFSVSGSLEVVFDREMDPSTINGSSDGNVCDGSIDVTINGFNCLSFTVEDLDGGFTFRLTPTIPYFKNQLYGWLVNTRARDINGFPLEENVPSSGAFSFTTGNYMAVIATTPEDGDFNVGVNPGVSVSFSENMNSGSITTNGNTTNCTGTVQVKRDGQNDCVRMFLPSSQGDIIFSFPYNGNLTPGNYTTTVTTGVRSNTNAELESEFTYRFSTGTPPQVISHNPTDGETGVVTTSNITIDFSETMSGGSITTNNGSTTCSGSVQLKVAQASDCVPLNTATNSNLSTYIINPISNLLPSQNYEVTVTTGVESQLGNIQMWEDYQFTFQTANTFANFEDNQDESYGKGMRCAPSMELNKTIGKIVKVSWKKNREKLVNSLGGGYEVFYKKGDEFYCKKVRYIEGEWAQSDTDLYLTSGKWHMRVKAYSRLNEKGSAFSKPFVLDIP